MTPSRRQLGRRLERGLKRHLTGLVGRLASWRRLDAPPPGPGGVRQLLVIRQHNQMGDMVLALPTLHALRRAYDRARLTFLTAPLCEELLTGHADIDRLLVFRKKEMFRPWNLLRFLAKVRRPRPDLAIVLGTVSFSTTSALLAWASGARFRAGVSSQRFGHDLSKALFHVELPMGREGTHEVEHNLAPLRGLGIEPAVEDPQLSPQIEASQAAAAFLAREFSDSDGPVVVVHPGAGKIENIWPVDRFADVAAILQRDMGARLVVSEGPRDATFVTALLERCPGAVRWSAPLGTTLGILGQADLFLGNDTGMAHVAAATGVATVAVFGPTDPLRWSPAGSWVRCVRAPSGRIEDTSVEDVVTAARHALSRPKRSATAAQALHGDASRNSPTARLS
jgi:ADP-heptose:LPS heptosyltransferase